MSHKIDSPVTRFSGSVTIKDPLPLSACVEWEAALADCQSHPCADGRKILSGILGANDTTRADVIKEYAAHFSGCTLCTPGLADTSAQERMMRAVRPCIEAWEIPAFDIENPPGSPKISRSKFVAWVIGEISRVYMAEEPDGDPNA
jgi:hypothetical protein